MAALACPQGAGSAGTDSLRRDQVNRENKQDQEQPMAISGRRTLLRARTRRARHRAPSGAGGDRPVPGDLQHLVGLRHRLRHQYRHQEPGRCLDQLDPGLLLRRKPDAAERLERHLGAVRQGRHRQQPVLERQCGHQRDGDPGRQLHLQRHQRRPHRLHGERHGLQRCPHAAGGHADQSDGRGGLHRTGDDPDGGHCRRSRRGDDQQGRVLQRHHAGVFGHHCSVHLQLGGRRGRQLLDHGQGL